MSENPAHNRTVQNLKGKGIILIEPRDGFKVFCPRKPTSVSPDHHDIFHSGSSLLYIFLVITHIHIHNISVCPLS